MRLEIGLKTLTLSVLMLGNLLETVVLLSERSYLKSPIVRDKKYADIRSINYNCALIDHKLIFVITKYIFPFIIIFLFKPITKVFNTNAKFFIFSFVCLYFIPFYTTEYYRVFVTESEFKFNVQNITTFNKDFVFISFVHFVFLAILCTFEAVFFENPILKRMHPNRYSSDTNQDDSDIELDISSSEKLSDVNLASESATMTSHFYMKDKLLQPIVVFFTSIVLIIMNQVFMSRFDHEYALFLDHDQTIFNKSIEFLSENNANLFSKRVKYGISKTTLHTGLKQVGIIHPTLIFSLNNFYYTKPEEALNIGPIIHSILQSKDNLVRFLLDVVRVLIFCIILFGVLNVGIGEFIYNKIPLQIVPMFISYCIFISVNTFLNVLTNGINRSLYVSHDCYAVTMGFEISKIIEKLYLADARYYSPSNFYKMLYMRIPTIDDHRLMIKKCMKNIV